MTLCARNLSEDGTKGYKQCQRLRESCPRPRNRSNDGSDDKARRMWDDEDNNPYGSFHRRDSETSDIQSPEDSE